MCLFENKPLNLADHCSWNDLQQVSKYLMLNYTARHFPIQATQKRTGAKNHIVKTQNICWLKKNLGNLAYLEQIILYQNHRSCRNSPQQHTWWCLWTIRLYHHSFGWKKWNQKTKIRCCYYWKITFQIYDFIWANHKKD